jgi:high-affinity Fe2+/Pb2+ permease
MAIDLFNSSAFFIVLRETLECTMIISVLLGLVDRLVPIENQQLKMLLKKRIWIGVVIGFFISIVISAVFITMFYVIDKSGWERTNEILGKEEKKFFSFFLFYFLFEIKLIIKKKKTF